MGLKITIDKNLEKIMGNYEKNIINNIKEKVDKETPKIENKVLDLVENKLNEFYTISVMNFYASYPHPLYDKIYGRRNSLYNLFKTKREGNILRYWFEPSEIPPRKGTNSKYGNDFLYETVFKEGWHGGANHNGVMRYRTPIPCYTHWGREAVQAPISPYNMFETLKQDYEKRGFKKDYRDIWIRGLNNIGINVR